MSQSLQAAKNLFFDQNNMDAARIEKLVRDGLVGADGGELYMEQTLSEGLSWSQGKLKGNSMGIGEGFGLRFIANDAFAYAFDHEMNEQAIKNAMTTVQGIRANGGQSQSVNMSTSAGGVMLPKRPTLYTPNNPLQSRTRQERIELLEKIDQYVRSKSNQIHNVSVNMSGAMKNVLIVRQDGLVVADQRPMVHMSISVEVKKGNRIETGSFGFGGRFDFTELFNENAWQAGADEALRSATANLDAIEAPAGEMPVVVAPGWTGGVMLHEAVGHGLEGDFNRKGTSVYSGQVGQQVAAKGITVVDQGDIADRRGSLNFDDEGTPTQENVLIEDGKLVGYMQDLMNARLMGVAPTGNGRRESYTSAPMPRMTTTFMRSGDKDPQEIIESVKDGFYAARIGGGQVDITSGQYVFNVDEGYLIQNGKIGPAVKGATLVGNGPDTMTKIDMIGNDMELDPGLGNCGKAGQNVPVGVGHPTVKIRRMTVGGTATPS